MKLSNICLVFGPRTRLVHIKEVRARGLINAVILHREKGERFRGIIGHPPPKMTTTRAEEILAKRKPPSDLAAELVRNIGKTHFLSRGKDTRVISPAQAIVGEFEEGNKIDAVIGHYEGKLPPEEARRIIESRQHVDQRTIARAEADVSQLRLPAEEIITLDPKEYRELGGVLENNPEHVITLPREVKLFKLTIGFLRKFAGKKLVGELLHKGHNAAKGDHEMIGYISVSTALKLLEIINPALENEMLRLRIPTEAVIDVFLNAPEYKKYCIGLVPRIMTASLYSHWGVNLLEIEVEVRKEEIDPRLEFVFRSGARELKGPHHRFSVPPINESYFNGVIFEVVNAIQALDTLPWGVEA